MSSEDKSNTQQAKAAEVAKEIKEGEKSLKGTDENPVQVATEDLKFGKEDEEDKLREKTAHVGKIASTVTSEAKGESISA
jgi:Flp pilus assembly protein CpaB|mmetsp:Transcript_18694/g.33826  ORF Transcript_18694/g.33826 Transcript_18694/m.33826 type:complete len:80 (-) Transcript_18694:180-419(-)|eukprot:CAMPEP_0202481808 /NCGR_PEP_ID=MMETSP1361-20130828/1295_1 /ASSEMBLY_ACC=CAM_ASM_000849 /TAXON_ID=210615 /ORGANISM="Staurosira complex sp., Strain CCMP2646" /LENGTH=79 /DNA_ID=CAMNT_0049109421 /DNA_START=184 /DNA_END=423 /DNA_ORIENTATION=+